MLGGQAEQGLGRDHGRAASVETEHELVDIVRQVLGADAVMGAEQPGLEAVSYTHLTLPTILLV